MLLKTPNFAVFLIQHLVALVILFAFNFPTWINVVYCIWAFFNFVLKGAEILGKEQSQSKNI